MTNSPPLVSIIIVNWNGERFLRKNLESVFLQSYDSFEVLFVDNGSSDRSVDLVERSFPKVRIIKNKDNLGFARANNLGIQKARGKYIMTLNNDTEVHSQWLEKIVGVAERSDSSVGMWAPKILSLKDRKSIDSVGGMVIYGDGIARGRGRGEKDKGQYDGVTDILFPSACSALYLKSMLDKIGCFDEDFFAYCEDSDLGFRARLAGWKALSVPDSIIYHYYSGTTGEYSETKAFLVGRNHVWLAIKNFPVCLLVFVPCYILWRSVVQLAGLMSGTGATSQYVKSSGTNILFTLCRSYVSMLKGIPLMLEKRKKIFSQKIVSTKEVRGWFKAYGVSATRLVND